MAVATNEKGTGGGATLLRIGTVLSINPPNITVTPIGRMRRGRWNSRAMAAENVVKVMLPETA